ncbi:hypothetical protein LTR49_022666 [Elasticomyces elasticus]|nr:hypothetical protein LTR49_022666 [Elasticomyces elasticus]
MSERTPWRIIRSAAPRELCTAASREVADAEPSSQKDGYTEYSPTPLCVAIAQHVHQVSYTHTPSWTSTHTLQHHGHQVAELKAGAQPLSINVCRFVKLGQPVSRISGVAGEIYFVTALTPLKEETGMFALRHDGSDSHSFAEVPDLDVGDAVIWSQEKCALESVDPIGRSTSTIAR